MDAKALNCPNCGAPFQVRFRDRAVNVVCGHCLTILDARSPELQILQKYTDKERFAPLIPLGSRGTVRGTKYEVIGFQRRTITVEGIHYSWHEYLLFNPYEGYRYLSEYEGHWNDIKPLKETPDVDAGNNTASHLGRTFKLFQDDTARTTFILGEFPWQVRVGDKVRFQDYISPPFILSMEQTDDETTWAMGEYTTGETIWQSFGLEGTPPAPVGVFANQPSPARPTGPIWKLFGAFAAAALVLMVVFSITARNERAYSQTFQYNPTEKEAAVVSEIFELKGRDSNANVVVTSNVDNSWAYFDLALINADTGDAWNFGKEISYYHGVDSDGSWSEGGTSGSATVPTVPPGRYYLRIEPESGNDTALRLPVSYSITVWRDQPSVLFFLLALAALLPFPLLAQIRKSSFEATRWKESGYTPGGSMRPGDADDDDDDR